MQKPEPINLVQALALLLCCQLAGESAVAAVHQIFPFIAFPGPVVGMVLLFVYLFIRGGTGDNLEATSGVILRNLSLLFVPASVGVIEQWGLIAAYGPTLIVAIFVSTVLTLLVTVGVFICVTRMMKLGDEF